MKESFDLVKVKWKDITHLSKAGDLEEIKNHPLLSFSNVGFLIHETKEKVILCGAILNQPEAGAYESDDCFRDILIIPKGMVVEVIKLKESHTK